MKLVGLVGWRGMVGSVLMQRMQEEGDFVQQPLRRTNILYHAALCEPLDVNFFFLGEFARGVEDQREFMMATFLFYFVD